MKRTAIRAGVVAIAAVVGMSGSAWAKGRKPAEATYRKEQPELCAAIRGNGELVMAHFNGLARLTEHYGLFDGLAGGSSGSISAFIYESILQNPVIRDCAACNSAGSAGEAAVALRAALLLKTTWAFLDVLGESEEAVALAGTAKAVQKISERATKAFADLKDGELTAPLSEAEVKEGVRRLKEVLSADDVKALVNPELMASLTEITMPGRKAFQLREARAAVSTFGKFEAEDPHIFFRPGLVSFERVAHDVGVVANFYGGRGGRIYDYERVKRFLGACAPGSAGLGWREIVAKSPFCGKNIKSIIQAYRARHADAVRSAPGGELADARVLDPVGKYANVLVGTMTLDAQGARSFHEGMKKYREGSDEFNAFKFKVYDRLKAGYWGMKDDLDKVMANPSGFDDLKTSRRMALGPATWKYVLSRSPAEPGLSRLREFFTSEGRELVSAGGWSDLAPVLALRNLGCSKVVYLTRRGDDSRFGRGIARNLGMTEAQDRALYDLDNPDSSLSRSIAAADAVYCTDWNSHPVTSDLAGLDRDSYSSPVELPLGKGPPKFGPPAGFPVYGTVTAQSHRGCGGR